MNHNHICIIFSIQTLVDQLFAMIMKPLIYLAVALLVFVCVECSQIPSNLPKLLDSSTPAYLGTIEPTLLDCDHFSSSLSSFFFFDSSSIANSFEVLGDEVMLRIFEYLRNDNLVLFPQLVYSCKRFYRLLSKSFVSRFNQLSPQLFLVLPPNFRLTFALKYLWDFEELFSIDIDRKLSGEELFGLVFVVLHLRNELYISPADLKFVEALKTAGTGNRPGIIDNLFRNLSYHPSQVPLHPIPIYWIKSFHIPRQKFGD